MIRTSETTAALYKALVAASKELSAVPKTKKSQGEKFSYTYATLDSVIDMLRSVLPKHGVWFLQQLSSAETAQSYSPALSTRAANGSRIRLFLTQQKSEAAQAMRKKSERL